VNDFLQQFLLESRELAEQATAALLSLERAPHDAEQLGTVFRAMHTLKGGAGIVDFFAMERAVHAAEDLLTAARAGRRTMDATAVGDCLACVDQVLQWLDTLEETGELPGGAEQDADGIVARFERDTGEDASPSASVPPDPSADGDSAGVSAGSYASDRLPARARDVLAAQIALVHGASGGSHGHLLSAAVTAANLLRAFDRAADADELDRIAAMRRADNMRPTLHAVLLRLLEDQPEAPAAAVAGENLPGVRGETTSRTLRVDAERIDALVRLTGEITIATNGLAHLAKVAYTDGNPMAAVLKDRHAAFAHLTADLQRSVLGLRVLPLRVVFQRFPRLLREMSAQLDKPVELKFAGEETEADKAIVEMLFEPLLHVLRNALDHGVERAPVRAGRRKPRTATIEMRASREGDQVLIEVADDGGGVDTARIRRVAAERGLADADSLEAMTEAEVTALVFAPGFSTATEVTTLSGRGVGMDAVRAAVERVGGRVSIHSEPGLGTTVRFLLPFSVMMTTVMSVEAGGQMFGVPLDTVVETIRVPQHRLGVVGAVRAVVVRDQTIPVFDLAQLLGEPPPREHPGDATIVIAAFAGQRCGLGVDALGERLDIILKPLDGLLAGTPGIAGTTLLGDGRVLLVLDIAELLQ